MQNDNDLDSVDQEQNQHRDGDQTIVDVSTSRLTGAERALIARLELSKQRESKAREELRRVRADSERSKKSFEALLDDAEKRSLIKLEIQRAEQDHLQLIITVLEDASRKAKAASELERDEYADLSTRLSLRIAELETTAGILESEVLRLKNQLVSHSRTLTKKETFGRDKARRLDAALEVLGQERTKIKSLEESSSMKIGRLITSSLKSPWDALSLLWRLPKMIFVETKLNGEGTAR